MTTIFLYPALVISLLVFIYFLPAIALFPRFIQSPLTAATIPFISMSLVVSIQYILSLAGQFNNQNVIIFVGFLSLLGLYRIYKTRFELRNNWTVLDCKSLLLITFSSIPLMIFLGFDGFQHADEIYSWNIWAKKIYLNQVILFESTGSPYPLLLPSFIAFCYQFFGNMDYQLPIKFTFSIIYISTIFIVFTFANTKIKVGIFFLSFITIILIIGIGYEYKKVYADTLMGGFLIASLALLLSLSKEISHTKNNVPSSSLLIASIILISAAALTKQGAMLWTMVFFPLLANAIILKNPSLNNSLRLILSVPILTPLLWYFIGGKNFQGNNGVISRSMEDRGYIEQLFYGFNFSFINNPMIFILIVIVFIVLLKKITLEKSILAIGIILSTILLFLFGAYETTRLYLHVILISWLIIFTYGDLVLNSKIGHFLSKVGNSIFTYILIGSLFIFWSISSFNARLIGVDSVSNLLDGREVQVNWVIGKSGAEQYRKIVNSQKGLWARDDHVWGIYYGMNNFSRGALESYDTQIIMQEIIQSDIGWIYSQEWHIPEIKKIQDICEGSIIEIDTIDNLYKQTLFKVSTELVANCTKSLK